MQRAHEDHYVEKHRFPEGTVSEKRGRGAIAFTYACEHCKLFPAEDFLWWSSTNHGEKKKKNNMSVWWCGACGMPFDWRKPERLLALQIGDTANEQVLFTAYSAPNGECDNMICVLKLVTNPCARKHVRSERQGPY